MHGSLGQNGMVERRNQTLMDMVRSMKSNANIPNFLWIESLKTVSYILIQVPFNNVTNTPLELFRG